MPADWDKDEWGTPQKLFDELNEVVGGFDLDACASKENTKVVEAYFNKDQNGLVQKWFGKVFCNPPYSRGEVEKWVDKALEETANGNAELVVLLLPAYTDTKWFHKCWEGEKSNQARIKFIKGRLKFEGPVKFGARFPSLLMLVTK